MTWWMKGRGSVVESAPALSECNEDIRHRFHERAEGFRCSFTVVATTIAGKRGGGFQADTITTSE